MAQIAMMDDKKIGFSMVSLCLAMHLGPFLPAPSSGAPHFCSCGVASVGSCSKSSSSPRAAWYLVVTRAKELWSSCVDGLVLALSTLLSVLTGIAKDFCVPRLAAKEGSSRIRWKVERQNR